MPFSQIYWNLPCHPKWVLVMYVKYIPPPFWAKGGLWIIYITLHHSLPSPRASDPAGLEVMRAYIVFSKSRKRPTRTPTGAKLINTSCLFFMFVATLPCGTLIVFLLVFRFFQFCSYALCRPSPAIAPTCKITTIASTAPMETTWTQSGTPLVDYPVPRSQLCLGSLPPDYVCCPSWLCFVGSPDCILCFWLCFSGSDCVWFAFPCPSFSSPPSSSPSSHQVRNSPKYQNDHCNDAHHLYAKLKTFIIRHGCRNIGYPRYQIITATKRIFHMQNLKPSWLDTVAELEALPSTEIITAPRRFFYMQHLVWAETSWNLLWVPNRDLDRDIMKPMT